MKEMMNDVARLHNALRSAKDTKFKELYKLYTDTYPRLKEKVEQRHMLTQMIKLYCHIEYDLWPMIETLFKDKIADYRRLMSLMLKIMQQYDREMSKLGFAYTAQPYLPLDERKSYDPKSVLQLQERVHKLTEDIKARVEDAKTIELKPEKETEKPLEITEKKKEKDDGNRE